MITTHVPGRYARPVEALTSEVGVDQVYIVRRGGGGRLTILSENGDKVLTLYLHSRGKEWSDIDIEFPEGTTHEVMGWLNGDPTDPNLASTVSVEVKSNI